MNKRIDTVSAPGVKNLTITVIYDNNPCEKGLETDWGFSAYIKGAEKAILFDTGCSGSLLDNMEKLAIESNSIEVVVLSHIHGDHTGGLSSFLEENPNVTIYLPGAFARKFKDEVRGRGAKVVSVRESLKICENVYSAGQFGRLIKEQSLIIKTNKGLVMIVGCAHAGILKIVGAARDLMKEDILLVMGGFHLEWVTKGKAEKVISAFERWGVRFVGPCHCTGEKAMGLFEEHFGKNYIKTGAGKIITIDDLG